MASSSARARAARGGAAALAAAAAAAAWTIASSSASASASAPASAPRARASSSAAARKKKCPPKLFHLLSSPPAHCCCCCCCCLRRSALRGNKPTRHTCHARGRRVWRAAAENTRKPCRSRRVVDRSAEIVRSRRQVTRRVWCGRRRSGTLSCQRGTLTSHERRVVVRGFHLPERTNPTRDAATHHTSNRSGGARHRHRHGLAAALLQLLP